MLGPNALVTNVVPVQIPDCRLTGAGIEKQIIGLVIAIELATPTTFQLKV